MVKSLLVLLTISSIMGCNSNEKKAKDYYNKGITCLEGGSYEEAEAYFSSAITDNNGKAEYYIAYGMALIKNGKQEEALKQFDKAIKDKNNQIVRQNNKLAYRGKGIASYESGQYDKAVEYLKKSLEIGDLKEYDEDITCYLADTYYCLGETEKAITFYDSVIKQSSENSQAYLGKARIYNELGDVDKAIENYDNVLKYKENAYQVYIEKYFMLKEKGENEQAENILKEADQKIVEKTEEDSFYRAIISYYNGDESQAIDKLSAIAAKGYANAYYYLGKIYEEKKDYGNAAYDYAKYIEIDKNCSGEIYNKLAVCYVKTEKYEEAAEILEKGIEEKKQPDLKKMRRNLIAVYEKMTDFDKAYEVAKNYMTDYPDDKEIKKEYNFLSTRVYQNTENGDENSENGNDNEGEKQQ